MNKNINKNKMRLFKLFKWNKKNFMWMTISTLTMVLVGLVYFFILQYLFQIILPEKLSYQLPFVCLTLIGTAFLLCFIVWMQSYSLSKIKFSFGNIIIPKLWINLFRRPLSFFKQFYAPDLILRLNSFLYLRNLYWQSLYKLIILLSFSLCFFALFFIDKVLSFLIFSLVLFYFFIYFIFLFWMKRNFMKREKSKLNVSNLLFSFFK